MYAITLAEGGYYQYSHGMELELLPGESVRCQSRINQTALILSVALYGALIAAIFYFVREHKENLMVYEIRTVAYLLGTLDSRASLLVGASRDSVFYQGAYIVTLLMVIGTIIQLFVSIVRQILKLNTMYFVTSHRLIVMKGVLWVRIVGVPFGAIQSVELSPPFILPGSLLVIAKPNMRLRLPWVEDVGTFYSVLCQQVGLEESGDQ